MLDAPEPTLHRMPVRPWVRVVGKAAAVLGSALLIPIVLLAGWSEHENAANRAERHRAGRAVDSVLAEVGPSARVSDREFPGDDTCWQTVERSLPVGVAPFDLEARLRASAEAAGFAVREVRLTYDVDGREHVAVDTARRSEEFPAPACSTSYLPW